MVTTYHRCYEENIEVLEERIQKLYNIKTRHNKYNERQLKQAIKRTADRLIEENRVKRHRLGQGAHRKLDDEDESFVARCIENETSAHGRRHDKVLYTHKRVKKVNLLGIVNYNHIQRGLPLIKSASTVYNRGKARNIRSRQAKNHIGNNLFCTKKHQKQRTQQQSVHTIKELIKKTS